MELVISRILGDKKVEHSGYALKTKNWNIINSEWWQCASFVFACTAYILSSCGEMTQLYFGKWVFLVLWDSDLVPPHQATWAPFSFPPDFLSSWDGSWAADSPLSRAMRRACWRQGERVRAQRRSFSPLPPDVPEAGCTPGTSDLWFW